MKGYPSVWVTRSHIGDREYANLFYGEGNKLLYQLKNQMKPNDLGQLKMTRPFTDGTIITASSVFGHDQIIIDVSKSTVLAGLAVPSCSITLFDFPTIVPPMGDPGEILPDDYVDKDYISTYFMVDISKCKPCNPEPKWEFSFEFTSPTGYEYYNNDPNDHLILSLDGLGYGEVIQKGQDESGTYVLWKVYTEGVNQTRTGYGFIKVLVSVVDRGGNTICSTEKIVKVDCCWKNSTEREVVLLALRDVVNLWKEGCEDRGDCESYGECEESWWWCPVPLELPSSALLEETSFNARPENLVLGEGETKPPGDGSCLPYVWELISSENIGSIESFGDFNESMIYTPPDPVNCHDEITISVKDRCETLYQVLRKACCDEALTLEIGYTSLQMSVDASQTLTAIEGCPPYSWSKTAGGGTLTPSEDTLTALYTAPSSNPNCINNPTIVLTDCCGSSDQITIAVNATSATAGTHNIWTLLDTCNCIYSITPPNSKTIYKWNVDRYYIKCDGSEDLQSGSPWSTWTFTAEPPVANVQTCIAGPPDCYECGPQTPCSSMTYKTFSYDTLDVNYGSGYYDTRTQAQKDAGCCPWQLL